MSGYVDQPLRGIGLNLLASIVFCAGDTIAKQLSGELAIVQIVWTRYTVFVAMALLLTTRMRGAPFRVRSPRLQFARGVCQVGSALFFILGIRDVGLAEAATIGFIGPILVTLLAIPMLGERVDARRWFALAAGMAGVLCVLRPGTGTFHPEGLYRVVSAAFWAVGQLLTRRMVAHERPETTMFWTAFTGLVVLSAVVPFALVKPTGTQLALSVIQGFLSSCGQWLVIMSLRFAPVSTLAPYSYMQLLWMSIAGFAVFGVLPDHWTLVGAAIIVGSGLYTAQRERRR